MQLQPPPDAITPTMVEVVPPVAPSLSMIDVALAAFGVTGFIMVAALAAGLLAGALFIWFRQRHAVSTMEEQGGSADLFRA